MPSARQQLMGLVNDKEIFNKSDREMLPLQLEAARELFAERRQQIQVLDKRARDTGTTQIGTMADIVPLLFAHTTYKSYPNAFVQKGQWDKMTRWFGTLSSMPPDKVNLDGVAGIDDWIDRLWAAGHLVVTTNGTSGKCSILNRSKVDEAFNIDYMSKLLCWPNVVPAERNRHFFMFGPSKGPYSMIKSANIMAGLVARPDSIHYLTDEPLRVSRVSRMAEMRAKMADGSATPGEIAAFEQEARDQQAQMSANLERMLEKIIALRHEPCFIQGAWTLLWGLKEKAQAAGVKDGEFHPDTIVISGGGLKGTLLPADWQEQLFRFFGPVRTQFGYGMTEMTKAFPTCEAGRYHRTPWIIPLILDAEGERLLDYDGGLVTGRFAMLDLSFDGRWGGLITGDKVTMDTSDRCPCGRAGATIAPPITRYKDLGEEDKIGCAGTIDGYIRGALVD